MRATWLVARRELAAYLRAPVAYVVGVLFLAVQGASFAALVSALSDPARPAPMGAVLEGHFGGTLLHWALELAVIALVSMRAVAEDRRAGTWEVLVTAPVAEGAAIAGKWLAASIFYALLWLPTLAYLIVLSAYAPAGATIDPGPIVSAYAGEWLIGAALLAVGVAWSAMTASQIFAGAASFAFGMALLLAGEAVGSAPDFSAAHPTIAAIAGALSPRAHLLAFARGEITLGAIVFVVGLTAVGLSGAVAAVGWGRRRDAGPRAIATCLIAIIAVLTGVIAARHPRAWDLTRAHRNSLEDATRDVLASLAEPVDATIIEPSLHGLEPLYDETSRVLDRIARAQPLVRVRRFDPARVEGGLAAIARDAGLGEAALSKGGAVVLARGDRRRVIDLLELAQFGRDALAAPEVTRLDAEGAIARALAELDDAAHALVCVTSGHDELAWREVEQRLARVGLTIEDVGTVAAGVPERCRVLVVAGPVRPLANEEVLAVRDWLAKGGSLVAAAAGGSSDAPPMGLEPLLATYGIELTREIANDPAHAIDLPGAFTLELGYADDPLTTGFTGGRRVTVWVAPRVLGVRAPAQAIVTTATGSAIAAVARTDHGTVLVFGGAEGASSPIVGRGLGAGDALVANAIARLAGRTRTVEVAAKTPEQVRLVMTSGERTMVVALCAGVIPLAYALLGLAIVIARRRRS
ncbi:MAG TPA: Gldg family protein [Kofleriaceae bacterium]|nr:Gldg family protein [Kofleriaceae bacterium]